MRGLFVTGTDTNIGKTVIAAALLHRCRGYGPVRYWKPVQTGFPADDDSETVRRLARCSEGEIVNAGVRLEDPLSPHLAARHAGTEIDVARLLATPSRVAKGEIWIVEGAGGVLVPIDDRLFMADLMSALKLPVIVVARSQLGTINHTLLTLEALRARSVRVAGVIAVGEENRENVQSIERFGSVEVLGQLPHLADLNAEALAAWAYTSLDPTSSLEQLLGKDPL